MLLFTKIFQHAAVYKDTPACCCLQRYSSMLLFTKPFLLPLTGAEPNSFFSPNPLREPPTYKMAADPTDIWILFCPPCKEILVYISLVLKILFSLVVRVRRPPCPQETRQHRWNLEEFRGPRARQLCLAPPLYLGQNNIYVKNVF